MGRPFESELARLDDTYQYALDFPIREISSFVLETLDQPVVAIGSGGSFTAASFLRLLHQNGSGIPSVSATPLQAQNFLPFIKTATFWLLSARGKNRDIIKAAETAEMLEPAAIAALCATRSSPLETLVDRSAVGHAFSFQSPAGRDGYLATNSLLASCIILERAYASALGTDSSLPKTLHELLGNASAGELVAQYSAELNDVLDRDILVFLYGAASEIGAIDVESKITESALANVQYADFRNFAHGRHHWLSQFGSATGVISLVDSSNRRLADRTANQFPNSIKHCIIRILNSGPASQIEALVKGYALTAALGRRKHVDPGRPGVADFGSKIYHLRTTAASSNCDSRNAAIRRKILHAVDRADQSLSYWLDQFLERLRSTPIRAVVFDLDGTLIDVKNRYNNTPRPELCDELSRLADQGLRFAVATGRAGGGVAQEFLRAAFPKHHWHKVIVGYSNASDLRNLDNDQEISEPLYLDGDIERFVLLIKEALGPIGARLRISVNQFQVTIRPAEKELSLRTTSIFRLAQECLAQCDLSAKVVMSSHSIDVISKDSGKLRIDSIIEPSSALKIGDMGLWPGNDYEMLAHGLGLSVDQVSGSPFNCWNLLPSGVRGLRGTVHYLQKLSLQQGGDIHWRDEAFS